VAGLEVGGDWHDAFWVGERSVALVVGDVVGRGLGAAATMGQLRSAIRALASTGLGPALVLDALDGYSARHDVGRSSTIVYAELRLDSRELTYACAGHPPPVLMGSGGDVGLLEEGRSLPLDTAITPRPRPQATVVLAPGDGILLYTDGLIERRARSLSAGFDRLLSEIRSAGRPLSVADLARRLQDSERPDDICLLSAVTR
jgi:serine phosphatase RsbU (regulator of sigma subunit)